jgi:hypothetical protein
MVLGVEQEPEACGVHNLLLTEAVFQSTSMNTVPPSTTAG